jgi:hypothetical protein
MAHVGVEMEPLSKLGDASAHDLLLAHYRNGTGTTGGEAATMSFCRAAAIREAGQRARNGDKLQAQRSQARARSGGHGSAPASGD